MKSIVDQFFDKIYYINLDENVERNQNMISQFEKYNITNYSRCPGVKINYEDVDPNLYRNFNKKEVKYINGSLGCRQAHLNVIDHAKRHLFNRILILEDDITFDTDPNELLMGNRNYISEYYDFLYFGGIIESHFRSQIVCAHALSIGSLIFDDILSMAEASGMEIDNFYAKILFHASSNYRPTGGIITKKIVPFNAISQNKNFDSNIQTGTTV